MVNHEVEKGGGLKKNGLARAFLRVQPDTIYDIGLNAEKPCVNGHNQAGFPELDSAENDAGGFMEGG